MRARGALKGLGVAAGAAAVLAGAAYGAERLTVARGRRRPDPLAGRPPPLRPDAEERVESCDGSKLRVLRRGSGPPVVCIHGVTLDVRTWSYQFESIPSAGFELVAYDQRGHGGSTLGDRGYDVEALGDDLHALLVDLDLRDALLVGHSMGGIAIQSFVARHPTAAAERVRGLVLLSTVAAVPLARYRAITAVVRKLSPRLPDARRAWEADGLGFTLARLGFGRDPRPSQVELVRRMWVDNEPHVRLEATLSLVGLDLREHLARVARPTFVIAGAADVLAPVWGSREIARSVPGAELAVLPGIGHMAMMEDARRHDELVVDFARRNAP